jgi:hypothetical protein
LSCPRGFFLPVRVSSRVFRGKFLALLRQAQARGELRLAGRLDLQKPWSCWRSRRGGSRGCDRCNGH